MKLRGRNFAARGTVLCEQAGFNQIELSYPNFLSFTVIDCIYCSQLVMLVIL